MNRDSTVLDRARIEAAWSKQTEPADQEEYGEQGDAQQGAPNRAPYAFMQDRRRSVRCRVLSMPAIYQTLVHGSQPRLGRRSAVKAIRPLTERIVLPGHIIGCPLSA